MSHANAREWVCRTLLSNKEPRGAAAGVQFRGLADKELLWKPGKELRIGFLEGSKKLQDRVFETLLRWTSPNEGGANLELKRAVNAETADIRISFDESGGSWSMIGTDARDVSAGEATMNLGWATETTAENDFASVVLHEFGHALGLLHEHNHPDAKIDWDKAAVYADLGGSPNNWDKKTIDDNVFAKFEDGKVIKTGFDNVSVMIYTVPPNWTTNGASFMPSWKLSQGDAETIRKLYG